MAVSFFRFFLLCSVVLGLENTLAQSLPAPTLNQTTFNTCEGDPFVEPGDQVQVTIPSYGADTALVWYDASTNMRLTGQPFGIPESPTLIELNGLNAIENTVGTYTFQVRIERDSSGMVTALSDFATVSYTVSPQVNSVQIQSSALSDAGLNTICANRTASFTIQVDPASVALNSSNSSFRIIRGFRFFTFIPIDTMTVNGPSLDLFNLGLDPSFLSYTIEAQVDGGSCGGVVTSSNLIDFTIVRSPTSDIRYPEIIYCPGATVPMRIPVQSGFRPNDGGGYRYALDFGDGSPEVLITNDAQLTLDSLNNVYVFDTSHVYAETGNYEILLRIEDLGNPGDQGCTFNWNKTLRIGNPERFIPDFNLSNFRLGDVDSTQFNLNNHAVLFFVNKTWRFGDGSPDERRPALDSSVVTHQYTQAGTYEISLNFEEVNVPLGDNPFLICDESYRSMVTIYDTVTPPVLTGYQPDQGNYASWVPSQVSQQGLLLGPDPQDSVLRESVSSQSSWSLIAPGTDQSYIDNLYVGHPDTARAGLFASNINEMVWVTRSDSTGFANIGEVSWVETPFISLEAFSNPFLTFRLWYDTPQRVNGAILQYTIGKSENWQRLGLESDVDQNPDWINERGIASAPGRQDAPNSNLGDLGWSGYCEGWQEMRYDLNALQDEINLLPTGDRLVRFRIAYSALPSSQDPSLIAVKSFQILESDRIVLWEHFVGESPASVQERNDLAGLVSGDDFALQLNYYTDPAESILYRNSPQESAAGVLRGLHYGIGNGQNSAMDGRKGIFSDLAVTFTRRKLDFTPYEISLVIDTLPLRMNFNILKKVATVFDNAHKVRMILVERGVASNGELYLNVVRRFLPSHAGITIPADLGITETFTLPDPIYWDASLVHEAVTGAQAADLNANPFLLVILVQDVETKEVFQTAFGVITAAQIAGRGIVNAPEPPVIQLDDLIQLYPNPGDDWVQLVLDERIISWELYNAFGQEIPVQGSLASRAGDMVYSLDTHDLPTGCYMMRFRDREGLVYSKRLVVLH